jgi:hypothetical protein
VGWQIIVVLASDLITAIDASIYHTDGCTQNPESPENGKWCKNVNVFKEAKGQQCT